MVKRRSTLITSLLWQLLQPVPPHSDPTICTALDQILMNSLSPALLLLRITCSSTLIASQFDRAAAAQAALMQHRRPHQVFLQAVLNHNRYRTVHSVIFSRCIFSIESVSIDKPNFSHIILITCSLCLKIATWVTTTNNLLSVFDQLILCDTTLSIISATEFCQVIEGSVKSCYQRLISNTISWKV